MPLRSGATLGAYKIIALLGSGGMGDVYRALDTRLGREVALKVLPPAVVSEPGRLERFNREARAIAALNHPHIVTIYSTEEADGVRFLTMELVEGRPLDQLVAGTGLPLARFFEIALPLTDAIAAAHQKQITHRDLKPSNVMLSDQGRVKVLDFGLARIDELAHPDGGLGETIAPITTLGMVVGTMPYMSPEQVEGREVDHRSDLFSLGVMFYEMLTGTRPFTGASSAALISAILRDPAPDIRARCADVPVGLERLIARCLEKAPDDRVQTARDVFNELRHVRVHGEFSGESTAQAGAAAPASMSIAVLPFSARGADQDAEEFGGALTEDVTTGLSMFSGLTVVAPQSARAFHDSPLDVRQIAERLGARFILTGQVRKSGLALRVSAQVVDAHSAALLWTETYDRSLAAADLFAIQDDLTDRIVATVADQGGVLIRSIVRSLRDDKSTSGSAASRLRVRSWDLQHNPTPADHADLRSVLEAAVQTEPGNTDLWATLANSYLVEHSLWFNPLSDSLGRARRAARRAIELDPRNQSGWQWLALACFYQRDRPGLEEALDHAIRINPRNATTLAWMGNILTHAGEYDRGCTLTGRAMEINPGHPGWLHFALFNRSFARGEYLEALSAARRVNIREFMWMHFAIAAAAGRLGRLDEARVAANEMARVAPFLADDATLREFITRWYWPEDLIQGLLEGLSVVRSPEIVSADPSRTIASASSSRGGASATSLVPAAGSLRSGIAVVVRPFTSSGSGDTARTIAEALTTDVATGLSRFTYVRLMGGSAANRVATAPERYAVEGEVRAIGSSIRVTARLVDLASGVHSWADTYSRDLTTDAFALVDDVASRIVATVADGNGALLRAFASTGVDGRDAEIMNLLLRLYGYTQHFTAADHAWLRDALTALTVQEPENARAWAFLGMLAVHEVLFGFNAMPLAAQRAQQLAERALAIDAANQSAWSARALAAFIRRDLISFRAAGDRALDLNPLHSLTTATIGLHFVYIGESERGAALVRRAMSLNPHHPGWYHIALFLEAYRLDNADAALMHAARITMPHIPMSALFAIAAAGRFERIDDVRAGIDELSRRDAGLLDTGRACTALSRWILDEALLDSLMDGIRKAFALSPR